MSWKTHYDPVSDKIFGAKKDTLSYYHEEGHRYWYKKGIEPALQMWLVYFLIGAVWFLAMELRSYAIVCMCIVMSFWVVSEIHAWVYAIKKRNHKKTTEKQVSPTHN